MKLYAEYQRFNPFRDPEWRFNRVLFLTERVGSPGRCTRRDDYWIRKARNFMLRWHNRNDAQREELFWEMPGLYYAFGIHEKRSEEPEPSHYVQARLLAAQPHEIIADALSTTPEAIQWYEKLFFNVSDRLQNRDWISKQILTPAAMRHRQTTTSVETDITTTGSSESGVGGTADTPSSTTTRFAVQKPVDRFALPFLDFTLKLFAYCGGPHVVDVLINGFQAGRPVSSQDEVPNWFDQGWALTIKRRSHQAAMQFEINKYNVMELFATHARILEIERSEDSQEQARTTIEKHIKAMVDEIPWMHGDKAAKHFAQTPLGIYDEYAAELRDDERLKIAAGETVEGLEDLGMQKLPPPRKVESALGLTP
jgi:hypothetical protein